MKTLSISVRLLRQESRVEDALRADCGLTEITATGVRLFVAQKAPTPPRWLDFVNTFASESLDRLNNQSCGAVLFVSGTVSLDVAEQDEDESSLQEIPYTCAVSFGAAHHGLDPDAFERNFGLRVVLNAVSRSNLRGLDTATLDATTVQRRIQTSRNADLQAFGMDVDRDLLRLASGTPSDQGFASSLSGKDALVIHKRLEPSELIPCCMQAVTLFRQKYYQRDFGFIDHVVPVLEGGLLAILDGLAFAELSRLVNGQSSDLHLALPDILSPDDGYEVGYFGRALRPGTKRSYVEVNIEGYVAELRDGSFTEIEDMTELRSSHEIRAIVNGETDRSHKRRVYDCFVLEVEHDEHMFVLFGGAWFQVDREFHANVEADFTRLLAEPFVATTSALTEREFIDELNRDVNLLNLDQVKLSPAGAPGANLEPCDFLSRSGQFIHLKDGHSSAPISHLWNQGLVSAESFIRDANFRAQLRSAVRVRQRRSGKTGFDQLLPNLRNRPVPADHPIVFGIMRTPYARSGTLGLPFFSKVSLRSVAARIDSMGFPVEVHLIKKLQGEESDE